jgi:hypothetical protein
MHHRLDATLAQKLGSQGKISNVAAHEGRAAHGVGVAGGKIVQHGDLGAALQEQLHHVRADVTGAAGHEDPHSKRSASTGLSRAALRAG